VKGDDRSRREADIVDRGDGHRGWAESAPTESPREGLEPTRRGSFHRGREKSITARSRHRPKPPRTWVGDRTFDLGRNECHSNGLVFSICFVSDCHGEKVMNSERQASRFSIVMPEI
jgi:hypothetical protein